MFISISSDIFSLFSNESGSYVVREEMEKMLHVVDGKVPESLKKCFSEVCHAPFPLLYLQKKKVKITLSSFFFILMHVWEQIDLV